MDLYCLYFLKKMESKLNLSFIHPYLFQLYLHPNIILKIDSIKIQIFILMKISISKLLLSNFFL